MLQVIERDRLLWWGRGDVAWLARRCVGIGLLAMSLVLSACSERTEHAASTVRDSAGITIVENRAPHWHAGDEWVIEPEPLLEIGLVDGPAEYLLSGVMSAVRLSDGTIGVMQDGGTLIRLYDSEGRYLTSHGRAGDGPGELRSATLAAFRGDSLIASDISTSRVSIFNPREGFVRSFTVPTDLGHFSLLGAQADVAIGRGLWLRHPGSIGGDSAHVVVVRLDGSGIESAGVYPTTSTNFVGRNTITAIAPNGIWFGDGNTFEVRQHDLTGKLTLISRYAWTPVAVTAEARARLEEQRTSAPPGEARPRSAIPEHLPPYFGGLSDSEGNLWVMSASEEMSGKPTWRVFTPAGTLLGEVEMPSGFVPFQIGRDFVLVRHWDEMLVEYVRVHRLYRGGRI